MRPGLRYPPLGAASAAIRPEGAGFAVDPATGLVTLDTAPDAGAAVTAGFAFDTPGDETWQENLARWLDRAVDTIAGAPSVPDYVEPEEKIADAWPELARARELGLSQVRLYDWRDGTPVITAAVPVGLQGATLLTGGHRIGSEGNFWSPTVLTDVPLDAKVFNDEPFGPIAPMRSCMCSRRPA